MAATELALPLISGNICVAMAVASDGVRSRSTSTFSTIIKTAGVPATISEFVRSSALTANTSVIAPRPICCMIWSIISLKRASTSEAAACSSLNTRMSLVVVWSSNSDAFLISSKSSGGAVTNRILLESSPMTLTCCRPLRVPPVRPPPNICCSFSATLVAAATRSWICRGVARSPTIWSSDLIWASMLFCWVSGAQTTMVLVSVSAVMRMARLPVALASSTKMVVSVWAMARASPCSTV